MADVQGHIARIDLGLDLAGEQSHKREASDDLARLQHREPLKRGLGREELEVGNRVSRIGQESKTKASHRDARIELSSDRLFDNVLKRGCGDQEWTDGCCKDQDDQHCCNDQRDLAHPFLPQEMVRRRQLGNTLKSWKQLRKQVRGEAPSIVDLLADLLEPHDHEVVDPRHQVGGNRPRLHDLHKGIEGLFGLSHRKRFTTTVHEEVAISQGRGDEHREYLARTFVSALELFGDAIKDPLDVVVGFHAFLLSTL